LLLVADSFKAFKSICVRAIGHLQDCRNNVDLGSVEAEEDDSYLFTVCCQARYV